MSRNERASGFDNTPGILRDLGARRLDQEYERVRQELLTFHDDVLPWLLRRPVLAEGRYVGLAGVEEDGPAVLAQITTVLADWLRPGPGCPTDTDVQTVIASVGATDCSGKGLVWCPMDESTVASAHRSDGERLHWRLGTLLPVLEPDELDERARAIGGRLGVPVADASQLRQALEGADTSTQNRLFQKLSFPDEYTGLGWALVQIYPAIPAVFFTLPDKVVGLRKRVTGDGPLCGSLAMRGPVSNLLGLAMAFLANNHFEQVGQLARLPHILGPYQNAMPVQILSVLYRKAAVLRYLSHQRWRAMLQEDERQRIAEAQDPLIRRRFDELCILVFGETAPLGPPEHGLFFDRTYGERAEFKVCLQLCRELLIALFHEDAEGTIRMRQQLRLPFADPDTGPKLKAWHDEVVERIVRTELERPRFARPDDVER